MKPFTFLAKEHNVDFFAWCYHGDGFFNPRVETLIGDRMHQLIVRFDKFYGEWGAPEEEWNALGDKIVSAIQTGKLDFQTLKADSEKVAHQIVNSCHNISDEKIRTATDAELAEWFDALYRDSAELVALGFVPVASDFHHAALTNALQGVLEKRAARLREKSLSIAESASFLSSGPLSPHAWRETQSLYAVAQIAADKGTESEEAKGVLRRHAEEFGWINYGYLGPLCTEKDFVPRIVKILKENPQPQNAFLMKEKERHDMPKRQDELMRALNLDAEERRLFEAARMFLYLKALRVDVRSLASYTFDRLFKEIGRRHGLTRNQMHCANRAEIVGLLGGKPLDSSVLNKRYSGFTYYWSDDGERFLYGKEENAFLNEYEIRPEIATADEWRGQVACPGVVKGRVKIVMTAADNGKVIHGDILVSLATNPDLLPAMHRARAFVTDMGGITSHAAIVAREMKKPCVIGTKVASKVLKDGDYIEVDATQGIVRKLNA